MTRYDLAIFDFDGTLADSGGWFRGKLNHIADRFKFRRVSEAELEALRGLSNRDIVRALGVPAWKLPLIATYVRDLLAREAPEIALFDGADALLAALAECGSVAAIVTSNSEANVRRILGAANAARVAHYNCGAGLFGKARKFRAVLKHLRVPAARAICIGDEARDIEAARAAGLACGAVTWGYAAPELLRAHKPDYIFDTMTELSAFLASAREPTP